MKRILIFVISIVFSVNLTAQIGIDLTEMVNAPDSGYIIITTGDEYPERGLQKYVAFDSLIPLDTFYQKTDSVCFRFAYDTKDRCFELTTGGGTQTLAVIRDGDTIRLSISDGNTVAFRDSTRSNADIADVARDSLVVIDTIINDGDSVRTYMSDGRVFTVRDSSVDASTIQKWISDSIPDIVFYVKTGDAVTPVEWHDIVEINSGVINVNTTEIEVTYDSLTHSLEFCQYTTIIDTIAVQDTGLIFNGTNQYLREATVPTVQFDLPIEITFSVDAMPSAAQALIGRRYISSTANTFDVWLTPTGMQLHLVSPTNTVATIDFPFIATPGAKYTYRVEEDDLGGLVQYIDGVEMKRDQSWPRPGTYSGSYQFRIAARD